jgi:hypothetical protein
MNVEVEAAHHCKICSTRQAGSLPISYHEPIEIRFVPISLPSPHAEGKPIPSELRREEGELRRQVELEDDNTAVPRSHVDDEYASAGLREPKVLITTSRDPSSRLVQFAKELKLVLPNSQRINRGGQVVGELVEACRSHEFTDIVVLHEHRGEPDGMVVCHLPYGPTAYFGIFNTVRLGGRVRKVGGCMCVWVGLGWVGLGWGGVGRVIMYIGACLGLGLLQLGSECCHSNGLADYIG